MKIKKNSITSDRRSKNKYKKILGIMDHCAKCCSQNSSNDEVGTAFPQTAKGDKSTKVKKKINLKRVTRGNSPFVWLLGPPGTGKRTQGTQISSSMEYVHISVPDLVVEESRVNSDRGEKVSLLLDSKNKFPEDIALTLLKEALTESSASNNKPPAWLISGYPRLLHEAYRFEREVGRCGLILYMWADSSLLSERIFRKNASSNTVTPPNIVHYLEKYHERVLPLLQTYSDRLEFIDASKSPEDIFGNIEIILNRFNENIPRHNSRTYETQWLNFKERARLADEFKSKYPSYMPFPDDLPDFEDDIPHWWKVESSAQQLKTLARGKDADRDIDTEIEPIIVETERESHETVKRISNTNEDDYVISSDSLSRSISLSINEDTERSISEAAFRLKRGSSETADMTSNDGKKMSSKSSVTIATVEFSTQQGVFNQSKSHDALHITNSNNKIPMEKSATDLNDENCYTDNDPRKSLSARSIAQTYADINTIHSSWSSTSIKSVVLVSPTKSSAAVKLPKKSISTQETTQRRKKGSIVSTDAHTSTNTFQSENNDVPSKSQRLGITSITISDNAKKANESVPGHSTEISESFSPNNIMKGEMNENEIRTELYEDRTNSMIFPSDKTERNSETKRSVEVNTIDNNASTKSIPTLLKVVPFKQTTITKIRRNSKSQSPSKVRKISTPDSSKSSSKNPLKSVRSLPKPEQNDRSNILEPVCSEERPLKIEFIFKIDSSSSVRSPTRVDMSVNMNSGTRAEVLSKANSKTNSTGKTQFSKTQSTVKLQQTKGISLAKDEYLPKSDSTGKLLTPQSSGLMRTSAKKVHKSTGTNLSDPTSQTKLSGGTESATKVKVSVVSNSKNKSTANAKVNAANKQKGKSQPSAKKKQTNTKKRQNVVSKKSNVSTSEANPETENEPTKEDQSQVNTVSTANEQVDKNIATTGKASQSARKNKNSNTTVEKDRSAPSEQCSEQSPTSKEVNTTMTDAMDGDRPNTVLSVPKQKSLALNGIECKHSPQLQNQTKVNFSRNDKGDSCKSTNEENSSSCNNTFTNQNLLSNNKPRNNESENTKLSALGKSSINTQSLQPSVISSDLQKILDIFTQGVSSSKTACPMNDVSSRRGTQCPKDVSVNVDALSAKTKCNSRNETSSKNLPCSNFGEFPVRRSTFPSSPDTAVNTSQEGALSSNVVGTRKVDSLENESPTGSVLADKPGFYAPKLPTMRLNSPKYIEGSGKVVTFSESVSSSNLISNPKGLSFRKVSSSPKVCSRDNESFKHGVSSIPSAKASSAARNEKTNSAGLSLGSSHLSQKLRLSPKFIQCPKDGLPSKHGGSKTVDFHTKGAKASGNSKSKTVSSSKSGATNKDCSSFKVRQSTKVASSSKKTKYGSSASTKDSSSTKVKSSTGIELSPAVLICSKVESYTRICTTTSPTPSTTSSNSKELSKHTSAKQEVLKTSTKQKPPAKLAAKLAFSKGSIPLKVEPTSKGTLNEKNNQNLNNATVSKDIGSTKPGNVSKVEINKKNTSNTIPNQLTLNKMFAKTDRPITEQKAKKNDKPENSEAHPKIGKTQKMISFKNTVAKDSNSVSQTPHQEKEKANDKNVTRLDFARRLTSDQTFNLNQTNKKAFLPISSPQSSARSRIPHKIGHSLVTITSYDLTKLSMQQYHPLSRPCSSIMPRHSLYPVQEGTNDSDEHTIRIQPSSPRISRLKTPSPKTWFPVRSGSSVNVVSPIQESPNTSEDNIVRHRSSLRCTFAL